MANIEISLDECGKRLRDLKQKCSDHYHRYRRGILVLSEAEGGESGPIISSLGESSGKGRVTTRIDKVKIRRRKVRRRDWSGLAMIAIVR